MIRSNLEAVDEALSSDANEVTLLKLGEGEDRLTQVVCGVLRGLASKSSLKLGKVLRQRLHDHCASAEAHVKSVPEPVC